MHKEERTLRNVQRDGVEILVAIEGEGPSLVVLPSYGRDGFKDFDEFTDRLVHHGLQVVRPQPRGIAGSQGPLHGIDLTSLAADVAAVIEAVAGGRAIVLGHAFGSFVARVLSVERPDTVRGVILAAASATVVAPDINATPFIAGDPTRPEQERLAALRKAFFAPDHDPGIWLDGWYPTALAAQHEAVKRTILAPYWFGGRAPLLEIIPRHDPFKPEERWSELRDKVGDRATTVVVENAAHALFPEQPGRVAELVLEWIEKL